jgi:hypothetical protein
MKEEEAVVARVRGGDHQREVEELVSGEEVLAGGREMMEDLGGRRGTSGRGGGRRGR